MKLSRIVAYKNTQVFSQNKQIKASVLWTNDSRIHRNIKIARDDSASERISEQAIILSLEMRPM